MLLLEEIREYSKSTSIEYVFPQGTEFATPRKGSAVSKKSSFEPTIIRKLSYRISDIENGEVSKSDIVSRLLELKKDGPIDKKQALTSYSYIMIVSMVLTTFTFPYFVACDYKDISNKPITEGKEPIIKNVPTLQLVIILGGICNSLGRL